MDSDIADLLKARRGGELAIGDFVERLTRIAKKRSWEQELNKWKKLTHFKFHDDAWAATVKAGGAIFVVVLVRSPDPGIPGEDIQTAFLLDNQGGFLDMLYCEINSRLTFQEGGDFHAVIPTKDQPDGAQLIIRLDDVSARGNWSHHLHHGKEKLDVYWGNDKLPKNQPSELDAKGLCRIAIKDKRFQILFPHQRQETPAKR